MKNTRFSYQILLMLVGLTLLSLILRIYKIDQIYTTLNRDEAALGYNAYLLKTAGVDEWGVPMAATLQSFGDWKLIGYPLMLMGLYQFLSLSDLTVRLPSILAGTLLIPATFWLAYNLTKNQKKSLLVAGFTATTPIFFFYSRLAYEANVALTLTVLAICLLFFRQSSTSQWYKDLLAAGGLLYGALTYNTPIFLIPILVVVLIISIGLGRLRLWLRPTLVLFLAWLVAIVLTRQVLLNKTGITIFSDSSTILARNDYYSSFSAFLRPILGNQYIFYAKKILLNLSPSFSYDFLVKSGGHHPWHQLPGWGHISPLSYLLLLYLVYKVYRQQVKPLLPLGLLAVLSLLPSTITIDTPHATRSLLFIYLLVVLTTTTIPIDQIKKSQWGKILVGGLILLQILYFSSYLKSYFQLDDRQVGELKPGFAQVIKSLEPEVSDPVAIVADGYQYILLAWYLKLPAQYYLDNNQRGLPSLYGLRYGERVGRFHFIANPADRSSQEKNLIWFDLPTKQWQIE